MGDWTEVVQDAASRHRVTSVGRAASLGVSAATFYRRTSEERGWSTPFPGVRVTPGGLPSVQTQVVSLLEAIGAGGAAGRTGAWLHGLRPYPPDIVEVVVPHGRWRPRRRASYRVRLARWLTEDDVVEVEGVPVLALPALLLSAGRWERRELRALAIDALHRGLTDLDRLTARAAAVGPVEGVGNIRELVRELGDRRVESVFHDEVLDVLDRQGYRPARTVTRIATPDRRGLGIDIALPWNVAVEPEGDAFHRSRAQRRADRRRTAQYAGTDWVPVPVDWRDWMLEQRRVLDAVDAAILAQRARGFGHEVPLPPHLHAVGSGDGGRPQQQRDGEPGSAADRGRATGEVGPQDRG
jgi:hypothetical protein